MTEHARKRKLEALRRYVRGGVSDGELVSATRELEVLGGTEVLHRLSLSTIDLLKLDIDIRDLARQLGLYLTGQLQRETISRWVEGLHGILTALKFRDAGPARRALLTSACVVSLLLDAVERGKARRARRSLEHLRRWLLVGRPILARKLLPEALRSLGHVRLCALENPLLFPGSARGQWTDVGLCEYRSLPGSTASGESLRLIPFSVFTRSFFWQKLPALIARLTSPSHLERPRRDDFHYHPENNKAVGLREKYPRLEKDLPTFEYYVDEDGLVEILLDVPVLGRTELLLATRLFCLQNRIRRATLDGVRISGAAIPAF